MSRKNKTKRVAKPAIAVIGPPRPRRYRLLAELPRAISLTAPGSFRLRSGAYPEFAISPFYDTPADQMKYGGSFAAVEFVEDSETDLLRLLALGSGILSEALAALALVSGAPLAEFVPIQLIETTPRLPRSRFVFLFSVARSRWPKPINEQNLQDARTALAHWDDLGRLRRAAYLYADAIGRTDWIDVFERAWLGLEALEPLLAKEVGRDPGSEPASGSCSACGAEYTYNKTVLGGVRAFVTGELHRYENATIDTEDWKRINGLRQKLMHSKVDLPSLRTEALEQVPAVLHYLHDASAHLAHVHHLEVSWYESILPSEDQFLFLGETVSEVGVRLEDWRPLLQLIDVRWPEHDGAVTNPEFKVAYGSGDPPVGQFFFLARTLSQASEADLEALGFGGWHTEETGVGVDADVPPTA